MLETPNESLTKNIFDSFIFLSQPYNFTIKNFFYKHDSSGVASNDQSHPMNENTFDVCIPYSFLTYNEA